MVNTDKTDEQTTAFAASSEGAPYVSANSTMFTATGFAARITGTHRNGPEHPNALRTSNRAIGIRRRRNRQIKSTFRFFQSNAFSRAITIPVIKRAIGVVVDAIALTDSSKKVGKCHGSSIRAIPTNRDKKGGESTSFQQICETAASLLARFMI